MIIIKPHLRKLFEQKTCDIPFLRDWQDKFCDFWNDLDNIELIGLRTPTGSGKTLIGLLILDQALKNNLRGVYLTHTWHLMNRIAKEAERLKINNYVLGGATGITGKKRDERDEQIYKYNRFQHIIISNYAAFLKTKDFPQNIDVLIIDDVDLFYEALRNYFSVKIKNSGTSKEIYEKIIESLSHRNYPIIKKIKEGTAQFEDGNLLFPHDYNTIEMIINENINFLKHDLDFLYNYKISREYLDYYLYFLSNRELSIEPYIFPANNINIPGTSIKRFEKIKKIILLSATLGNEERFITELGMGREKIKIVSEDIFKEQGINIKMGEKLIFPVNDTRLDEVFPLETNFIKTAFEFISEMFSKFNKILILCWSITEKMGLIEKIIEKFKKIKIFNFTGKNFDIFNDFSLEPKDKKACLLIANRYFGLEIPSEACDICLITRLPTYLSNFDIILDNFSGQKHYYYELQKRRITQSLGRINRSENDFTSYFILDKRFREANSDYKDFYPFLDNELKLIIDFSYQNSHFGNFFEELSLADKFINEKDNIREDLQEFFETKKALKNPLEKNITKLLNNSYKYEISGWKFLYENNYQKAIENFEALISKLSEDIVVPEFKKKIEWYNFILYIIYFKQQKRAEKDFTEELRNYETKVVNSELLTWLNEISLFITEDIKIKPTAEIKSPSKSVKKFKSYSENLRLFLGDYYDLEELKDSLNALKEICTNLADGYIESPVRNFAIEVENICKKALKKRLPHIYEELKDNKNLVMSEILMALYSNHYLRKSIYKHLDKQLRDLRNFIVHTKSKVTELADTIKYCNIFNEEIKKLLKDIYFSDILRSSKETVKNLKQISVYKYKNENELITTILNWWQFGDAKFCPGIDEYTEITSYSGELKKELSGQEIIIKINTTL